MVLHQAMKSVPEFLGISGVWCAVLNTCVGGIQGVLGGLVLPMVAKKLSGDRLSFLLTMGLMTSCLLPAAVIIFLDTHCLGRWSECWDPCRNNPEQFNRVMDLGDIKVPLLRSADICDSYQAISQETIKDLEVESSRSYQSSATPLFRATKAPKTLVSLLRCNQRGADDP